MKQTAVEWLENKLDIILPLDFEWDKLNNIFEQAKEMEKQQIVAQIKQQNNTITKHLNKTNMKGILHKAESGWIVIYDEVLGENIVKKNQNALPLIDNGHIDGLALYKSNEGLEVEFEIVANEGEPLGKGEQPYKQYAKLI